MSSLECLGVLLWVGRNDEGVGVRKRHHRERHLAQGAGDHSGRMAEVELGLALRMCQRHEHLGPMALAPCDRFLDLRDSARVAVLIAKTLEDPL